LLGIFPKKKKKGTDESKGMMGMGKRALVNEESPEDLFGLLGIFPNKKKKNTDESKGMMGMGKRALVAESDLEDAFNSLDENDRKLAVKLAEEGDKEALFGLLGIFPKKKKGTDESKGMMGKRALVNEESPEDLFGLLGIFPNKKKKGTDESKGMMGKRALVNEESPEDLFGLLGIFPNKKKKGTDESKGMMGKGKRALVAESDLEDAFDALNENDRKLAVKLAEEGDKEALFGLLGIFPKKKKGTDESKGMGMGMRRL
jgi:hypothetical protein